MANNYSQLQQEVIDKIKKNPYNMYRSLTALGIENYGRPLAPQMVENIREVLASFQAHNVQKNHYFREKKEVENDSFIFFEHNNNPNGRFSAKDLKTRVYIPINEQANNAGVIVDCFKQLNKLGFNYTGKLAKVYRNDSLMFEFGSKQEARIFAQNIYPIIQKSLGVHNPFIKDFNGLGVLDFSFDPTKESYTSILSDFLEDCYWQSKKNNKDFSVKEFRQYIKGQRQANNGEYAGTCDYITNAIDEPMLSPQKANTSVSSPKTNYVSAALLSDPLEKCKADLENYELVSTKNGFEVRDRKSGKTLSPSSEMSAENIKDLKETLAFTKLFMGGHDKSISHSFAANKFGYDERVYDRAFSEEGKYTFGALVSTMRNIVYGGGKLSAKKIIAGVEENYNDFSSSGSVIREMFSQSSQNRLNALNAGKLQEYEEMQKLAKCFLANVGNSQKFSSIKAARKENN